MSLHPSRLAAILSVLVVSGVPTLTPALAAGERPNFLVILADDLGIECLSTYGGTSHETPNLDALASQGMRFTHGFSNPTCSPSRANLLTGRYPFLHDLTFVIWHEQRHANHYLRLDQPSFARQLKQVGYTTAIAGKWQLSFLHQRDTVRDFGFDRYQCWQIYDDANSKTRRFHRPHFNRNGTIRDDIADRYGPEVNVDFLIEFIEDSTAKKQPFLAYYTSLLPHYPWVPTPDSEDQRDPLEDNTAKGDPKFFPDMVRYLDKNVGRLMATLDRLDIAENTVVIFLADNGTDIDLVNRWGDGKSVPGGKGTMTDRGTRVPLIVRWPGNVAAGSTCDDLVDFSDFFPTLCDLAKAPLPEMEQHGRSFAPQLLGEPGEPREWVHVQDHAKRHLRGRDFILTHRNELRPTVEIWQAKATALSPPYEPRQQAAFDRLRAAFDRLGRRSP